MAALSAEEMKRATEIAQYVEQIPAAAVTEMLERVLNYTGDDQRKVSLAHLARPLRRSGLDRKTRGNLSSRLSRSYQASPVDAWVLVHPGAKKVHYPRAPSNSALGASSCCVKRAPLPNVHKDSFRDRMPDCPATLFNVRQGYVRVIRVISL